MEKKEKKKKKHGTEICEVRSKSIAKFAL